MPNNRSPVSVLAWFHLTPQWHPQLSPSCAKHGEVSLLFRVSPQHHIMLSILYVFEILEVLSCFSRGKSSAFKRSCQRQHGALVIVFRQWRMWCEERQSRASERGKVREVDDARARAAWLQPVKIARMSLAVALSKAQSIVTTHAPSPKRDHWCTMWPLAPPLKSFAHGLRQSYPDSCEGGKD